tara:strand:+ start:423 stop:689 length:267 start_codon:yes stop_codon:yes gene_type:complete
MGSHCLYSAVLVLFLDCLNDSEVFGPTDGASLLSNRSVGPTDFVVVLANQGTQMSVGTCVDNCPVKLGSESATNFPAFIFGGYRASLN